MVKATELRIGNVFWEDYGGYKIVTAINCNKVGDMPNTVSARASNFSLSGQFDCDKISPIPLTEEVLIRCGFKMTQDGDYWRSFQLPNGWWISKWTSDECLAGFEKKGSWYYGETYLEVTSLHQLMNLYYALTGEELIYKP